jgi:hypothetical protein
VGNGALQAQIKVLGRCIVLLDDVEVSLAESREAGDDGLPEAPRIRARNSRGKRSSSWRGSLQRFKRQARSTWSRRWRDRLILEVGFLSLVWRQRGQVCILSLPLGGHCLVVSTLNARNHLKRRASKQATRWTIGRLISCSTARRIVGHVDTRQESAVARQGNMQQSMAATDDPCRPVGTACSSSASCATQRRRSIAIRRHRHKNRRCPDCRLPSSANRRRFPG